MFIRGRCGSPLYSSSKHNAFDYRNGIYLQTYLVLLILHACLYIFFFLIKGEICVMRADASSIMKTHACYASDNNNTRLGLALAQSTAVF